MEPKDLFEGQSVDIECSECKHTFSVAAEDVFEESQVFKCPNCQASNQLDPEAIRDLRKALDDFESELEKLNTTINIDL